MANVFICKICGEDALEGLHEYGALPRVTSDCKPWPAGGVLTVCRGCGTIQKIADQTWCEEIAAIYEAYELYHQSDGAEQLVFDRDSAVGAPRSAKLVDYLTQTLGLPQNGSLLDVGCGNGASLVQFSQALPDWTLFGSELNTKALPILRKLKNFKTLFTCSLEEIPGDYSIISLVHSLEHMPNPLEVLCTVTKKVRAGGWVLLQVPDVGTTPFDLLVADHLVHLTKSTLHRIAQRAGILECVLTDSLVKKELTLIGRGIEGDRKVDIPIDPDHGRMLATSHIRWLQSVIVAARRVAEGSRTFGVFGTSISGMWLFGALGDKVDFFVDEDPSRIGRLYEGRKIYSPGDVPAGSDVFLPLIQEVADSVAHRWAQLPVRFHLPPSYCMESN